MQAVERLPPLSSSRKSLRGDERKKNNIKQKQERRIKSSERLLDGDSQHNDWEWERKASVGEMGGPRFIVELERFVERKLRELGSRAIEPGIVRLQVFREVFEHLIGGFKTYRPLLAAIKDEYELVMKQLQQRINKLEPLQQMVISISEECEERIVKLRERERKDLEEVKMERWRLLKKIESISSEKQDLELQVERLKMELGAEYERYRNECDARKLLITEINELHYQREEDRLTGMNVEQTQSAKDSKDDIIVLKLALGKARENEREAMERLNEMVANYADVIPRRQHEQLAKDFTTLEEKVTKLKQDFKRISKEHTVLLDVHKGVVSQRDQYYLECETLKRSATPRPDWSRCADFVAGGEERWRKLCEGKSSSRDLVEILLKELETRDGGHDEDTESVFDGLGFGPNVPKYLQYEGKVYNRHMSKRDCALLVHDIWINKIKADNKRGDGGRKRMEDFVFEYLEERYSAVREMRVEWGYNLRDAVQRYSNDDYIGLFFGVLINEADEEIYHSQCREVASLYQILSNLDEEGGGEGTLTHSLLHSALSRIYSNKFDESITTLMKAAVEDLKLNDEMEPLNYQELFRQGRSGSCGNFVEEFKRQMTQEKLDFVDEILQHLNGKQSISVDDLRRAVLAVDSEADPVALSKLISWVFSQPSSITKEQEQKIKPADISVVQSKLQFGDLQRTSNKAQLSY